MDTTDPNPGIDPLAAIAWLEGLADAPLLLEQLPAELRGRLQRAAGRIAPFDRLERRKLQRRRHEALQDHKRKHDDSVLDGTSHRALKRSLRFPVAPPSAALDDESRQLLEIQASGPSPTRRLGAESGRDEGNTTESSAAGGELVRSKRLLTPKACYVCKQDYHEVHRHYDSLCLPCAEFNWHKRLQSADLSGRVSVVTGARVKIGYETALKLLRAGSFVVATTRFPHDATRRFAKESDFGEWKDRLEVYGLELRHTPSVETFAQHLVQRLDRLDFLIHNACQTVRRPAEYYKHLLDEEREDGLSSEARTTLAQHRLLIQQAGLGSAGRDDGESSLIGRTADQQHSHSVGITHAAALTQLDLLGELDQSALFPEGLRDGDDQQLDLRKMNSWRMQLAEVPTVELLEVHLVNSIAPFVLTANLKPLMLRVASRDKHIVNVSAMEGQFGRYTKTTRHPHTNMAQAALNMMTRTSAPDFAEHGIHMNSVDTGWVTDEDPFAQSVRKEADQRFFPPLDSVDGAARVLDPIFTGFLTGTHCWGNFLKDYAPTVW